MIYTIILALKKSNYFILREFSKRTHCPFIVTLALLHFLWPLYPNSIDLRFFWFNKTKKLIKLFQPWGNALCHVFFSLQSKMLVTLIINVTMAILAINKKGYLCWSFKEPHWECSSWYKANALNCAIILIHDWADLLQALIFW